MMKKGIDRTLQAGLITLAAATAVSAQAQTLPQSWTYTYDPAGNITSIGDADGADSYDYDVLDRLIGSDDASGTLSEYGYDALGNRTQYSEDAATETLTYAPDSNRLHQVLDGGTVIATYTYNARGQRVK